MKREYHKWFSSRLQRDMELLVFGHAGERVLVFPTRQGRFYDYEDWRLVHALKDRIENGDLQLFCVDSVDSESLYAGHHEPAWRIARHRQYESYILEEVIPFTLTCNANPVLVSHGCSIGAYHSMNIALRHPSRFAKVVALSGRYDLTKPVGPFRDLFEGYYDQDIYFHTPLHFLPSLNDAALLDQIRKLSITIVVGNEDMFYDSTLELSRILSAKGVEHCLFVWSGEAHRARDWRQMVRHYLTGSASSGTAAQG